MGRKPLADGDLRAQITRYVVSGGALTLLYSAIYWICAVSIGIAALIANSIAFVATTAAGFIIHSRWSFRGHGSRNRPALIWGRFFAVNIGGFALNSLWVWLIVERAGLDPAWPLIPIAFVTPWLSFYCNRRWTFR